MRRRLRLPLGSAVCWERWLLRACVCRRGPSRSARISCGHAPSQATCPPATSRCLAVWSACKCAKPFLRTRVHEAIAVHPHLPHLHSQLLCLHTHKHDIHTQEGERVGAAITLPQVLNRLLVLEKQDTATKSSTSCAPPVGISLSFCLERVFCVFYPAAKTDVIYRSAGYRVRCQYNKTLRHTRLSRPLQHHET